MTAAGGSRLPIHDCHILVVDDTDFNRTLIGALLNEAGFDDVAFAKDGFEALERIAARTPDLVVLDIMMPGMDGFEVCRRLRNDHAYADLPVLVQTALSSSDDRNRAFAVGTTDLVSKPLDRTELLARVRIHLENRVLIRDLQLYRARVEGELAMARSMYDHLLPSPALRETLRAASGVHLRSHTLLSSDLGGGIWGVLRLDGGRFGVYLLDMEGRGVAAVLNAFRLHTVIHELTALGDDPAAFLSELNDRAVRLLELGEHASVFYGVVDAAAGRLRYAAAAAPAPLLLGGTADGAGEDRAEPPVGAAAATRYGERSLPFAAGSALVLQSNTVRAGTARTGPDGSVPYGGVEAAGPRLNTIVERTLAEPDGEDQGDRFDTVTRALRAALDGEAPADDHTLVWLERPA